MSYTLIDSNNGRAIRCNRCNRISYNPRDVQMKYCSNCRSYHNDAVPRSRPDDDAYWLRRSNAARDEGFATPQETQRLFDSFSDNRPASSEPVCRPDTSIDYGNSSSNWDSSSSCDSSSSSSSDSGSCSSD